MNFRSVVLQKNTEDELDAKFEKRGHFKENDNKQALEITGSYEVERDLGVIDIHRTY